jgi:cobalt/nickel transport system permease protein
VFKLPNVPDSPLARWEARWKLAGILLAALMVASITQLAPAATGLLIGLLLVIIARLPTRWVLVRLSLFTTPTVPFLVILPFTLGQDTGSWQIGWVEVSQSGLAAGLSVCCRCLAIGCFALVLIGTAPWHVTLAAAHQLKVPGVLVLMIGMAYRYTILFADEFRQLRIALRTRGFKMRFRRHAYRTLAQATGALLVRGHERAERVAHAMRCRGFQGRFPVSTVNRMTLSDIVKFLILLVLICSLLLWDRNSCELGK